MANPETANFQSRTDWVAVGFGAIVAGVVISTACNIVGTVFDIPAPETQEQTEPALTAKERKEEAANGNDTKSSKCC